jgi:hypothetical protein
MYVSREIYRGYEFAVNQIGDEEFIPTIIRNKVELPTVSSMTLAEESARKYIDKIKLQNKEWC